LNARFPFSLLASPSQLARRLRQPTVKVLVVRALAVAPLDEAEAGAVVATDEAPALPVA
jgi:hypothetical protein